MSLILICADEELRLLIFFHFSMFYRRHYAQQFD
nr:MAG TPA: hypothetical protein [Caudoviricetes sp.]